ncbi:MAG: hypothetical protein V1742_00910, partial [Pseudomonadota bacterium]
MLVMFFLLSSAAPATGAPADLGQLNRTEDLMATVRKLASLKDRSSGSPGSKAAARLIKQRLTGLGFNDVRSHRFTLPVRQHQNCTLEMPDKNLTVEVSPFTGNAITPEAIKGSGLTGPVIYVGSGRTKDFNGKVIEGSIVLMELDSAKNWLDAASLGAKALIYVDRGPTDRTFFQEKT